MTVEERKRWDLKLRTLLLIACTFNVGRVFEGRWWEWTILACVGAYLVVPVRMRTE